MSLLSRVSSLPFLRDELFAIQSLVLSDHPPEPVDVIWFFGRAKGDTENPDLFSFVAKQCQSGLVRNVLINGSEGERMGGTTPGESWEGKTVWTKRLAEAGVPLRLINYSRPAGNTKVEGEAYLDFCRERGWRSAALVCQPHQAARCMMGLVRSMQVRKRPIRVYTLLPRHIDWFTGVYGSQGRDYLPRHAHIHSERLGIRVYRAKRDLCSYRTLLEYYEKRDFLP